MPGRGDAEGVVVALSTAPTAEVAGTIAHALVSEALAACVNIVPGLRSIYRWDGELHDDAELLLVIKTTAGQVAALRARLPELHPYQLPELVVLEVTDGLPAYLAWVRGP
jgi:periplasmic divalent cation tolerance protein